MDIVDNEDPNEVLRSSQTLIPHLYDELRQLASYKINNEGPNQTLSGTALLHEAYLRLDKEGSEPKWASKKQFYYAAAEAMRRILIDRIRAKRRIKRGRDFERTDYEEDTLSSEQSDDTLLAINESLDRLEETDPAASNLVKLRFFAGLTLEEVSQSSGTSIRTLSRQWAFAKAWLARDLKKND